MSNEVFPSLPGLQWNVIKTPVWKTRVQQSTSGKELRAAYMSYPLWRFTLNYEVLRADAAHQELQQLIGLFNRMRGSWDNFLYEDPDDKSVVGQQFGIGDGSTKDFQLVRSLGNFAEPVQNLHGTPSIYLNGVLQSSGYTVSSLGVVSFTVAPGAGVALTWDGSFYYRVRFLKDSVDFDQFMKDLWQAKKIEFQTEKL